MRVLADVAAGKLRLEDTFAAKEGLARWDARRFVGESFGVAARQQYLDDDSSAAPGFHARRISALQPTCTPRRCSSSPSVSM
jgi:hypothetical protein